MSQSAPTATMVVGYDYSTAWFIFVAMFALSPVRNIIKIVFGDKKNARRATTPKLRPAIRHATAI